MVDYLRLDLVLVGAEVEEAAHLHQDFGGTQDHVHFVAGVVRELDHLKAVFDHLADEIHPVVRVVPLIKFL